MVSILVDSRLPESWLTSPRFEDLSDAAWRIFTCALMWCNAQGTDGAIPLRYADRLLLSGPQPDAYAELESAGLWVRTDEGFQLQGWGGELGQSTAEYVRERKEANREKVAAWRQKQRQKSAGETSDVTGGVTGYVGQAKAKDSREDEFDFNNEPPPFCSMHPRGSTEPCIGCMNARTYRDRWMANRPSQTARRYRQGDGHACVDNGFDYCRLCEDPMPVLEAAR